MKKCPFCAEEIQDAAIKCRYCASSLTLAGAMGTPASSVSAAGRSIHDDVPASRIPKIIGTVFLCILIVGAVFAALDNTPPAGPRASASDFATGVVGDLVLGGLLVKPFNCSTHDAYVNPILWASIDADQKEKATMAVAAACVARGERKYARLHDNMSGKIIARFYGGSYEVF